MTCFNVFNKIQHNIWKKTFKTIRQLSWFVFEFDQEFIILYNDNNNNRFNSKI